MAMMSRDWSLVWHIGAKYEGGGKTGQVERMEGKKKKRSGELWQMKEEME